MLHLIPPPLHRSAYRLAHRLRLLWWRVRRPRIRGVRILAFDAQGCVLLVRHSYGSGNWMLPGGGLGRDEDPVAGAVRELAEEVGCRFDDARLVEVLEEPLAGACNSVSVVTGRTAGRPSGDRREVVAAQFFAPGCWPDDFSPAHRAEIDAWVRTAATALRA
jgi:8-oxo-dGTP pyrophosphatase MutT (NUDIX family)